MSSRTDCIELKNIEIDCIIGILARERQKSQQVKVAIAVHLDTHKAARSCLIADTVDYATLYGEIRFILANAQFQLLETAADAVLRYVLHSPIITQATVKIEKPHVMPADTNVCITMTRHAGDYTTLNEHTAYGAVDILQETNDCGIYLLQVFPKHSIATHYHAETAEHELVLSDGLLLQGKPVARGSARVWPPHFPHRYDNPTSTTQTILCINRPAYREEDEIQTNVPISKLKNIEAIQMYPA